jgi:HK97 family phage prohead protease
MKGDLIKMEYDFSGWATRNDILCSDGRTIRKDAFKNNDGQTVPLVWNHQHDDPNEVLGHVVLENKNEGVYAYGKFNETEAGLTAKELVRNGDVNQLSIYANKLKTQANNVTHGCIREVSLVLAGANPGAFIESVVVHGEGAEQEEEAVIYNDEELVLHDESEEAKDNETLPEENNTEEASENKEEAEVVEHSDNSKEEETMEEEKKEVKENKEETVGEVFETLTEKQKAAVYAIVGQAIEDANKNNEEDEGEDEEMKHNVFEEKEENNDVLQHSEIIADAIKDAKKYGSMKESFLEHAAVNNITDIDKLFPDATEVNNPPTFIREDDNWVSNIMNNVKHTPFSRVKATFGRMDETQARAKGYIKGNKKANIALAVLNRVTTPTTVYIKNDIDRDDVIDITDFDVIAWQKAEMRKQLDRELALAMLLGDGRDVSDANKINEQNVRPVVSDDDLFTIKYTITEGVDYKVTGNSASENDSFTKGIVRAAIRARKEYKGSGKPTFYTTEDKLDDLLLAEDQNGRRLYKDEAELAQAMRVKEIVTIPEMEREAYADVVGIIVNMNDYTAGADKGGSINMFDDFDIDYNQMKYLMETRLSGALTVPYSAIVLKKASNNQANG